MIQMEDGSCHGHGRVWRKLNGRILISASYLKSSKRIRGNQRGSGASQVERCEDTLGHVASLVICNGLLKGRFEDADDLSERWQVVWPKALRAEFLQIAHGGMTGGHIGSSELQLRYSLQHIGSLGQLI